MSDIFHDINDDEIRIISSRDRKPTHQPHKAKKRHKLVVISVVVAMILLAAIIYLVRSGSDSTEKVGELDFVTHEPLVEKDEVEMPVAESVAAGSEARGYVSISDTIVNQVPLKIFTPVNLTPTLHIGRDVLNDSTAKFIVQAADVRSDNGGLVGAYVLKGELKSKGQAKSGFCAIIGGKITVGVAESTSLLEEALDTEGYFFRQYPLVVANQIVENKPRGKSLRKALAELNGETVVIMSCNELSFHQFSQCLVDLGVSNAIYLVGGKTYGLAIDERDEKTEFGTFLSNMHENTNYMVWR